LILKKGWELLAEFKLELLQPSYKDIEKIKKLQFELIRRLVEHDEIKGGE
jgi:hypothetical protein